MLSGCKYFVNVEWECSFWLVSACVSVKEGRSRDSLKSVCRCVFMIRSVQISDSVDKSSVEEFGGLYAIS